MLKNSEFIEEFKKSLSATVKSIGKNEKLEINFVKETPSITFFGEPSPPIASTAILINFDIQ